jgi:AcrR family transcriptional regulator
MCLTTVREGEKMKEELKNTKQQILETALNLFSHKGYSAVSIRDIGNIVGIKESTIYYHFKNKQDIFQELLKAFEEITNAKPEKFNKELAKVTKLEEGPFIAVGVAILTEYLLNGQILKFIRMLMIEQHVNEEAAVLYRRILFETPLKHNSEVFKTLMQMGCFKTADPDYLAIEYYAPIFLAFQRYFSSGDVTTEKLSRATSEIKIHLKTFYDKYNL